MQFPDIQAVDVMIIQDTDSVVEADRALLISTTNAAKDVAQEVFTGLISR